MRLTELDNRTVAVVIEVNQDRRVLTGTATYEHREDLGSVLNVVIHDETGESGHPNLLIPEESFSGKIYADERYGCDFCLVLQSAGSRVVN